MTLKRRSSVPRRWATRMVAGPEAEFFLFQTRRDGAPSVDTHDEGALLRPDARGQGRGGPARHRHRPRADGLRGRGRAPRGGAGPARDRLQVRRRHHDARTRVTTFRFVVKKVAMDHGLHATFMPKPIFGVNGSGHARPPVVPRQARATTPSTTPRPSTSSRRTALNYIGGILRPRRAASRPSPIRWSTPTSGWCRATRRRSTSPGRCGTARPLVRVPARRGMGTRMRGAHARPVLQPLPGLRRDAGVGARRREEPLDPGEPVNRTSSR